MYVLSRQSVNFTSAARAGASAPARTSMRTMVKIRRGAPDMRLSFELEDCAGCCSCKRRAPGTVKAEAHPQGDLDDDLHRLSPDPTPARELRSRDRRRRPAPAARPRHVDADLGRLQRPLAPRLSRSSPQ